MRKYIIVGILLMAFVAATTSAFAMCGMCPSDNKGHKHEKGAKMPAPGRGQAKADELKAKLNLTAEQEAKVAEINQAAKEKIKQIRIQRNEEIKAILTEEQKLKFKELRKKSEQDQS